MEIEERHQEGWPNDIKLGEQSPSRSSWRKKSKVPKGERAKTYLVRIFIGIMLVRRYISLDKRPESQVIVLRNQGNLSAQPIGIWSF